MNVRLIFLVCSLFSLGACTETRFASPPGDKIEACDPRWKGLWIDDSDQPSADEPDELAFLVDDECRFVLLERPEKNGPPKQIHIPVNFVHDRGKDYLVVADNQLSGVVDLPAVHGVKPAPEKAFFIAHYRIDGSRLTIQGVDSKRVAHLLLDDVLDGSIDSSHNELHVFVEGDGAKILEIVRSHDIFENKPGAEVKRIKLSLAEYETERSARRSGKSQ